MSSDQPAKRRRLERMDDLVSLCARRGFIFPSSEIYGGINGFWDYGPLGTELKQVFAIARLPLTPGLALDLPDSATKFPLPNRLRAASARA